LNQDIGDNAVLIYSPPKIMAHAIDLEEYLMRDKEKELNVNSNGHIGDPVAADRK